MRFSAVYEFDLGGDEVLPIVVLSEKHSRADSFCQDLHALLPQ